jgi:hypothetical protein
MAAHSPSTSPNLVKAAVVQVVVGVGMVAAVAIAEGLVVVGVVEAAAADMAVDTAADMVVGATATESPSRIQRSERPVGLLTPAGRVLLFLEVTDSNGERGSN